MSDLRIAAAGDAALLVELPAAVDPQTNARAIAIAGAVRDRCGTTIRDLVIGYCSLTIYFDPLSLDPVWLEDTVRVVASALPPSLQVDGALIDVPVCYGGELGPDLPDVAAAAGCTESDVVALHSGRDYRVYFVGFMPGFPYMADVHPSIALPRRATPRTSVPAGSVAIAAGQTGIYPCESPGGWHLIGRTRVKPYDPDAAAPFLFKAGDRVRFIPIERSEFDRSA